VEKGIIGKSELAKLVEAMAADATCLGPVKDGQDTVLAELGPDTELSFDYANFRLPVKRLFFPQSEVTCVLRDGQLVALPPPDEKTVLFGVRPCDAQALPYLTKIFSDEKYEDPYYLKRRENAVIVSLACHTPCSTCFCTSLGGSPAGRAGCDILAFDLGHELLLEAETEKGKALLAAHEALFAAPTDAQVTAAAEQGAAAEASMAKIETDGITEKADQAFDAPLWEEIAARCVACGVCTYLCPTCHCFGFADEQVGNRTQRVKCQDACMFPLFTLEASGHNPRTTQGQRLRQRIMHKFSYTVKNVGEIFCVGCGRCVLYCPVNIDLREIIEEVRK